MKKLVAERKARGWSQTFVASHLGITTRALRYIEQGEKLPSHVTANKIEDLFGMRTRDLLQSHCSASATK